MKPHKHAELIKSWADGAEIEYKCHGVWFAEPNPEWMLDYEYRIKHEPKKEIWQLYEEIRAITDGKSESMTHQDAINEIIVWKHFYETGIKEYNFKPEPKPDGVGYYILYGCDVLRTLEKDKADLKLTFDGETCELKSAEVLK